MTVPNKELFRKLLYQSSKQHQSLCPRQVLGIRMGLYALRLLGVNLTVRPYDNKTKRLFTIVESDGCSVDGISAATGCTVGHRTLRVEDYGKMAATVIDILSSQAVRVRPHLQARERALAHTTQALSRWHRYLNAYRLLPDEYIMEAEEVEITFSLQEIISNPETRMMCSICKEEIVNGRQVLLDGVYVCKPCNGQIYYRATRYLAAGD